MILVLTLALAGAAVATPTRPALSLADRSPLALRGTGFVPREAVRVVVVAAGERRVRLVRASARGTFVATFAGVSVHDACSLVARAVGSRRSYAKLPLPLCPPPLAHGTG